MSEEITLDDILWQLEKHPIDSDYVFGCKEVKIIYDSIIKLKKENERLQQESQKQKEVIDKAIEYINHFSKESEVKIYGLPKCKVFIGDIEELLEILKEVSK